MGNWISAARDAAKGKGASLRWLAGGGLGVALTVYLVTANTDEAQESRQFMRDQVTASDADARDARTQLQALVERVAVANERTAAAQQRTADVLEDVVVEQGRLCDSVDALRAQQEQLAPKLEIARGSR